MTFSEQASSLRILLDGWLDGGIRSYGYIAGSETLKNYLKGAAEVTLMHIQEEAENRGITVRASSEPAKAVEALGKIEVDLGMLEQGDLEIAASEDHIELILNGCPYAAVCSGILQDLIQNATTQSNLPCFRSEVYQAAVLTDTGRKSRYLLKQYAPGHRCTSTIELF